jgi:hypothetical protein
VPKQVGKLEAGRGKELLAGNTNAARRGDGGTNGLQKRFPIRNHGIDLSL